MSLAQTAPSGGRLPRRLALVVAVAFAATAVATLAQPSAAFAWADGSFSSSAEHDLIALTNQSRAAAGRKALKISSTLTSIARWRSKDMINRDYFSHSIPGYGNVFKKMSAEGYCYNLAGENIGWNNEGDSTATARIQQMFMASSGHRSNILGKAWDVIGVGAYKGADGKKMFTVLFADKCGSTTSKATTKPKPRSTSKPRPKPVERPKATPKPRPRATPRPTPEPTPELVVPPTIDRAEPSTDAAPCDATAPPTASPSPSPSPVGPSQPAGEAPHGLRVMDGGSPPGLLETLVGGVTRPVFGG
jgi:uncharacterized protein YkwD